MAHHNDLICKLSHVVNQYEACDEWWENQGLALDAEPDWPDDSIMVVSWPGHVVYPRLNGDCTISGPYASVAEARACARSGAEVTADLDGEWVAHTIHSPNGDHTLDACSPEAERIGSAAKPISATSSSSSSSLATQ